MVHRRTWMAMVYFSCRIKSFGGVQSVSFCLDFCIVIDLHVQRIVIRDCRCFQFFRGVSWRVTGSLFVGRWVLYLFVGCVRCFNRRSAGFALYIWVGSERFPEWFEVCVEPWCPNVHCLDGIVDIDRCGVKPEYVCEICVGCTVLKASIPSHHSHCFRNPEGVANEVHCGLG
jgi:hypothetical protein